jgi:DNA-binding winged helix-turn-helix (wHTH) protein
VPRLMLSSGPVAAGVRRKNNDGCYFIGEWIVDPEVRKIEKGGHLVRTCRELMDALLCLIEAHGDFVSLEQLKSTMWPNTSESDERAQSYVRFLQDAFKRDSGPEAVIGGSPETGYRLLVSARLASPDDAPKPELTKPPLPADPFKVDANVARYILTYHSNLMTRLECQVRGHLQTKMMLAGGGNVSPQLQVAISEEYSRYLSTDPVVLKLAADGYEAFAERTATRILGKYGKRLKLNRCPRCACVARTATARQCRFCGCDWHPK